MGLGDNWFGTGPAMQGPIMLPQEGSQPKKKKTSMFNQVAPPSPWQGTGDPWGMHKDFVGPQGPMEMPATLGDFTKSLSLADMFSGGRGGGAEASPTMPTTMGGGTTPTMGPEPRPQDTTFLSRQPRPEPVSGIGHIGSRMATGSEVNPRTGEIVPVSAGPMQESEFSFTPTKAPPQNTGYSSAGAMTHPQPTNPYAGSAPHATSPLFSDPRMQGFLDEQVEALRPVQAAQWDQHQQEAQQQAGLNRMQQMLGLEHLTNAPHDRAIADVKALNDVLQFTIDPVQRKQIQDQIAMATAKMGYPVPSGGAPGQGQAAAKPPAAPQAGFLRSAAHTVVPTVAGVAGWGLGTPLGPLGQAGTSMGLGWGANKLMDVLDPTYKEMTPNLLGSGAGVGAGALLGYRGNKMLGAKKQPPVAPTPATAPTQPGGPYWNLEGVGSAMGKQQPPVQGPLGPSRQLPPPSGPSGKVFEMPAPGGSPAAAPTATPQTAPPVGVAGAGMVKPKRAKPKVPAGAVRGKPKVAKPAVATPIENPVMTPGQADKILGQLGIPDEQLVLMSPQERVAKVLEITGQQGKLALP
jgi:hypothetical protein